MRLVAVPLAILLLLGGGQARTLAEGPRATPPALAAHALSMYGDLKYGPNFKHFEYANPRAPKGGQARLAAVGTFDTFNPFILKGVPAAAIGGTFDTLMVQSDDEPFSEYGLIAETIETPPDRSWVTFTLRREARFHDGSPITADDVIWTFDTLRKKGRPFYRAYYAKVTSAEKLGDRQVRFSFTPGDNRELPLILGQLPVLSRAYWSTHAFEKTTLEPPLGSGPYRVESFEPGRFVVYGRVKDYWGATLPVRAGRNNFDILRYDYYRDSGIALEAFKAGQYDFRVENSSKAWATGYASPALSAGLFKKEEIRNELPTGMQGYVFNTRRPLFRDRRVRQALGYAFDFEWTNRTLFYGAYTRTASYFANSELAARGLPGPGESKVLEPFRGRVPPDVFTRDYQPPVTDGSGFIRENLLAALRLLEQAGWVVRDMKLVNRVTGEPFEFEILLDDPGFERITLPFTKNLEHLGIRARPRTVDEAQYQKRVETFDFDVIVKIWGQSLSPGNEQVDYWTSERAGVPGSENVAGIQDPVVDALVAELIAAPGRQSLIDRTRALDRVLLWGFYVVPHWHSTSFRVAAWDKFGRPAITPKYNLPLDAWWIDPVRSEALARRVGQIFR
jgi:microcin C transport system substrate-binding protein